MIKLKISRLTDDYITSSCSPIYQIVLISITTRASYKYCLCQFKLFSFELEDEHWLIRAKKGAAELLYDIQVCVGVCDCESCQSVCGR